MNFKERQKNHERHRRLVKRVKLLNIRCPFCEKRVHVVDETEWTKDYDYPYECLGCDENFFEIECLTDKDPQISPICRLMNAMGH